MVDWISSIVNGKQKGSIWTEHFSDYATMTLGLIHDLYLGVWSLNFEIGVSQEWAVASHWWMVKWILIIWMMPDLLCDLGLWFQPWHWSLFPRLNLKTTTSHVWNVISSFMTIIMAFGWHIRAAYGHQDSVGFIVLRHSFFAMIMLYGSVTNHRQHCLLKFHLSHILHSYWPKGTETNIIILHKYTGIHDFNRNPFANSNETGTHCFNRHPFC